MVISEPAVAGLELTRERVQRMVAEGWARVRSHFAGTPSRSIAGHPSVTRSATSTPDAGPRIAAPPAGAMPAGSEPEPDLNASSLSPTERRARASAVRGLMLARKRCYGTAREAFAEAATLDPTLDLASVPTFWELHRAGQETAVRGYEQAGRIRDAAVLAGTLRYTFRPRALPTRRGTQAPGA